MTEQLIGIVIKKVEFNADDEVITILCEDEIVSFIALGTRKITSKNRVALDLGNIIQAEVFRARLKNKLSKLKKAILIKQPPVMTSDTANVLFEIMKNMQRVSNPSNKLFRAFLESYRYFGQDYNHHVKTFITARILDSVGLMPITSSCVECKRKDRINGFEFFLGGYTCAWHTKNERHIDFLKAINMLFTDVNMYVKTSPKINKQIYNELINFIQENIF